MPASARSRPALRFPTGEGSGPFQSSIGFRRCAERRRRAPSMAWEALGARAECTDGGSRGRDSMNLIFCGNDTPGPCVHSGESARFGWPSLGGRTT